jgi:hypothetical protein
MCKHGERMISSSDKIMASLRFVPSSSSSA